MLVVAVVQHLVGAERSCAAGERPLPRAVSTFDCCLADREAPRRPPPPARSSRRGLRSRRPASRRIGRWRARHPRAVGAVTAIAPDADGRVIE